MAGTKMPYRVWAVGLFLLSVNIKGVSSMRLHRELKIGQKAAWFMLRRLLLAFEEEPGQFAGPAEADETHMGGKRKNKPKAKRKELTGRGAVDMTPVAGAKDCETNKVRAKVVEGSDAETLQGFVKGTAAPGATLYTDEHGAYRGIEGFDHEAVNHSVGEYVRGMATTNGIESFRAMLKRGHQGIYHKMSAKHPDRYVQEFAGRHNARNADTIDQMAGVVAGMSGKDAFRNVVIWKRIGNHNDAGRFGRTGDHLLFYGSEIRRGYESFFPAAMCVRNIATATSAGNIGGAI